MARQHIDTTPPSGDPAPTAFNKVNANFIELYNLSLTFLPLSGGSISGALYVGGNFTLGGLLNVTNASVARLQATTASINIALSAVTAANEGTLATLTNHPIGVYLNSVRRGGWDTAGNFTATSLNPVSTSDVKDHLEGYTEDACELLDRLVVITYEYRKDFIDSDKVFVGLLQENVKSVIPGAATNSELVAETDEDGNETERLVPGNIDITQILAVSVRSHQQKSRRIKNLEAALAEVLGRLSALESAA